MVGGCSQLFVSHMVKNICGTYLSTMCHLSVEFQSLGHKYHHINKLKMPDKHPWKYRYQVLLHVVLLQYLQIYYWYLDTLLCLLFRASEKKIKDPKPPAFLISVRFFSGCIMSLHGSLQESLSFIYLCHSSKFNVLKINKASIPTSSYCMWAVVTSHKILISGFHQIILSFYWSWNYA